jgi:hypothetical protein
MVPVSEDTIKRAVEASNVFPNVSELLLPGTTCLKVLIILDVQERLAQEVLYGDSIL